ncbi:hypothetical protein EU546_07235 [Candidatus Thorarchaeota archaeon]|nr:MAG: hypothetical protein EU546_07235 [Candidatus Thorarchaeota archaeon]
MFIEELIGSGQGFFVGIAEVLNRDKKSREALLATLEFKQSRVDGIQLMNSRLIVDELHLLAAAQNAVNAFKGNYMISRSLDVETAVYASGQKQISKAFDLIGVGDKTASIALVVISQDEKAVRLQLRSLIDSIGEETEDRFRPEPAKLQRIAQVFDIPESEIEVLAESDDIMDVRSALSKCVVSRVSSVALDA